MLEVHHHGVGRGRDVHRVPQAAHPLESVGRILEIIVVEIRDRVADADSLLDAPHAVWIETQRRLGECRAERAKDFDVVVGRKEPAFQLVRLEAVAGDQVLGVRHHVVGRDFSGRAVLVAISVEEVARERHFLAQSAAEEVARADVQIFACHIHAGEFERGVQLQAVVVERRHRIHDLPAELLELQRIVADEILLQPLDRDLRGLAAAAHFADTGQPLVGIDLDDRADEAPPMRAVRMPERGFERNRDRRRAEVGDLH